MAAPTLVRILAVCAALAFTGVASIAQKTREKPKPKSEDAKDSFYCAMHGQIRMPGKGKCPICGMDLIRQPPARVSTPIEVRDGKLREFCVQYIDRAMKHIDQHSNAPRDVIVTAWSRWHGDSVRDRLRSLLNSTDLNCVAAAATELDRLDDREALPAMYRLLADRRLRLRFSYYCDRHVDKSYSESGVCSVCKRKLSVGVESGLLTARLVLAGAIHHLGGEAGFAALEKMSEGPFGAWAYDPLALRDTPRVRRVLAAGTAHQEEFTRDLAHAAQLKLGVIRDLDAARRQLKSPHLRPRRVMVTALRKLAATSATARAALQEFVARKDLARGERAAAAIALAKRGDAHYLDFILDAVTRARHEELASSEIQALGEVGTSKHLFVLERVIKKSPRNRATAVAAVLSILGREKRKK
jgi:Heavy metal binding domain